MRILWDRRELLLKIVYYGPPLAGKTTNLQQLQRMIDPRHRSDLLSLDTQGDRTLFFDLIQVNLGKVGGLTPRVSLYTVPGQPRYQRVRDLVLRGSDGIVFVADSHPARLHENLALWREMHAQLQAQRMTDRPIVVQVNKQDLPNALPAERLYRMLSPDRPYPWIAAQARHGIGVQETFTRILTLVLQPKEATP